MSRSRPRTEGIGQASAAPFAFWAVLLGALAAVQAGFGGKSLPVLVQTAAAAVSGLIALALITGPLIVRRRAGAARAIPDLSLSTALVAISLAATLAGATVGTWLILGGFLGLVLGACGLIREYRAQRRARLAITAQRANDSEPARRAER